MEPVNGSTAGAPELAAATVPDVELASAVGTGVDVRTGVGAEVAWIVPGPLGPDRVAAGEFPLPSLGYTTIGSVTAAAPRPAALTARTRTEGRTIPALKPSM